MPLLRVRKRCRGGNLKGGAAERRSGLSSGVEALGSQSFYAAARCLGSLWRGAEAQERIPRNKVNLFFGDSEREDPEAQLAKAKGMRGALNQWQR